MSTINNIAQNKKINIAVIGATGYMGLDLFYAFPSKGK